MTLTSIRCVSGYTNNPISYSDDVAKRKEAERRVEAEIERQLHEQRRRERKERLRLSGAVVLEEVDPK
jgi:hypothetical protein